MLCEMALVLYWTARSFPCWCGRDAARGGEKRGDGDAVRECWAGDGAARGGARGNVHWAPTHRENVSPLHRWPIRDKAGRVLLRVSCTEFPRTRWNGLLGTF